MSIIDVIDKVVRSRIIPSNSTKKYDWKVYEEYQEYCRQRRERPLDVKEDNVRK